MQVSCWMACLEREKAWVQSPVLQKTGVTVQILTSPPGRWSQEKEEFKVIFGYLMNLRLACATGKPVFCKCSVPRVLCSRRLFYTAFDSTLRVERDYSIWFLSTV